MASTRLNQELRHEIKKALLKNAFVDRANDIIDREIVLAERAYYLLAGDNLKLLNSIPAGWLLSSWQLNVKTGLDHYDSFALHFGGNSYSETWHKKASPGRAKRVERQIPVSWHQFPITIKDESFMADFAKWRKDSELCADLFNKASRAADVILAKATTVQKLIELWPEAEPFARPFLSPNIPQAKIALPAIRMEEVNILFGLPVDNAA